MTSGPPRRVLVAPDKFKGTLTAAEAARAIAAGVRRALPGAQIRTLPLADGGEGSVDAAVAAGALRRTAAVQDPLGAPVLADWAEAGGTAVVEVAAASGLALVDPSPATAARADTRGTGELITAVLDAGIRTIVLGIGGTASTDGGTGLLTALGVRFLGRDGEPVRRGAAGLRDVVEVDLSGLDPRCAGLDLLLCCDVEARLTGPRGAAQVFGPQKGAGPDDVVAFDEGMASYARVLCGATGRDVARWPFAGAGGAVSAGLHAVLGARAVSGADHLADVVDLDGNLAWADLLVVGEGSLDAQSLAGKAPVAAARRARALSVPVIAVAGRVDVPPHDLRGVGIQDVASAVDAALADGAGPRDALREPHRWVVRAAEVVTRRAATADRAGSSSSRVPAPGP